MRDGIELLVAIADSARDDGAAERVKAGLENERARREMIGERVMHNIARSEPAGEQGPRGTIAIRGLAFRLEDRAGRHHETARPARRRHVEAAERRIGLLQRR